MSETVKLNAREILIQRVLEMTEEEANLLLEALEDAEDIAIVESRKGEVGIPLDEVLEQLGYTREELMEAARADGLVP